MYNRLRQFSTVWPQRSTLRGQPYETRATDARRTNNPLCRQNATGAQNPYQKVLRIWLSLGNLAVPGKASGSLWPARSRQGVAQLTSNPMNNNRPRIAA